MILNALADLEDPPPPPDLEAPSQSECEKIREKCGPE